MRGIKREYIYGFLLALAGLKARARIVRIDVTSDHKVRQPGSRRPIT
jgi:hypothetical protein